MNSRHSLGLYLWCSLLLSYPQHSYKHRVNLMLWRLGIFWQEQNSVTFAVSFRRFHCWVLTVTVLHYSSTFLGPWWGQKVLSVVQLMLNKYSGSLEVDGHSVSWGIYLGGSGIGTPSQRDSGRVADDIFRFSTVHFFFLVSISSPHL